MARFIAGQNGLQIPTVVKIQGQVPQFLLPADPSELTAQIVPIDPSRDPVVINFPLLDVRYRRIANGFRGRGRFFPVFFNGQVVLADGSGLHPIPQPPRLLGLVPRFEIVPRYFVSRQVVAEVFLQPRYPTPFGSGIPQFRRQLLDPHRRTDRLPESLRLDRIQQGKFSPERDQPGGDFPIYKPSGHSSGYGTHPVPRRKFTRFHHSIPVTVSFRQNYQSLPPTPGARSAYFCHRTIPAQRPNRQGIKQRKRGAEGLFHTAGSGIPEY